jgi:MEDS: MEthanogen/methylotroph, DcmR Sensory domain
VAAGTGVLDVERRDHIVLFYRDEQELTERVSEYLLPAIQDGGVAIVVATPDHRRSFERYLADAHVGVDVAAACARGYLALDASETMRGFMVADRPDPAGFWQAISPMLRQAAKAGWPVRVFGEMVSLLWDAGLIDAAIEVEAMWNELGAQYPFSLLCAYPARPAVCAHQLDALTEVCRAHTQVTGVPPEAD